MDSVLQLSPRERAEVFQRTTQQTGFDAVIQHLTSLIGADVEVTMEIQARVADGIPENVVRTVSENCKTLKFQNQGFEQG